MKKLILSAMAMMAWVASYAASAEFKKIWIETNVTQNGEKGVLIHTDFDLKDVKNRGIECQAIFYAVPGKRALHDINNKYRLSPSLNYVSANHYYKENNTNADVKDCTIFIPTSELHLQNPRKYRVFVKLSLYADPGKTGEFLTDSDYIPFIVDNGAANDGIHRYDYDPSQPPIKYTEPVEQAPGVEPAKSNEEKFVPLKGEPERDSKGRPKRKKAKVFIS